MRSLGSDGTLEHKVCPGQVGVLSGSHSHRWMVLRQSPTSLLPSRRFARPLTSPSSSAECPPMGRKRLAASLLSGVRPEIDRFHLSERCKAMGDKSKNVITAATAAAQAEWVGVATTGMALLVFSLMAAGMGRPSSRWRARTLWTFSCQPSSPIWVSRQSPLPAPHIPFV